MPRCRLLPHGGYTLIPAVLSTVGWLASLSQDGCDFARVTGPITVDSTGGDAIPYLEVGLTAYREPIIKDGSWTVQYTGTCLAYDETVFVMDGYWKAAKGFAFLSLVLGGGGALFLWFSSCFVFSRATWRWAGYEVLWAGIFQSLAFLWFQTEMCTTSSCSMFYGSKADIAAAVLWFVSALLIFCRYPSPKPIQEDEEDAIQHGDVEGQQSSGSSTAEMEDVPVEGDSSLTIMVESKKGNDSVVQTTPADSDLL